MSDLFRRTIAVTFLDAETSTEIARSDVPLEQLPETFAVHTDLSLAGQKYVVVRADPETKAEFSKTRRLVVTLNRLRTIDPSRLLYSLPSICGSGLPTSDALPRSGEVHVLHEDDWRQCEFIDAAHAALISRELAAIRRIHDEAAASVGWREIHVRELIERPLPEGITWSRVKELLGPAEDLGGVAFGDPGHPVENAPASRLAGGVVVWGVQSTTGLATLCIENVRDATRETATALARISDALSLACVRWCPCRGYMPGGAALPGATGAPWDTDA
jgi:hypothetical protein